MKTVLFGTLAVLQLIGHANAQECEDLLKLALSQHKAAQNLIQQSDDLKDVAMARFQSGSNFQRPTQQAFTKMLEARGNWVRRLHHSIKQWATTVGRNMSICAMISETTSKRLNTALRRCGRWLHN